MNGCWCITIYAHSVVPFVPQSQLISTKNAAPAPFGQVLDMAFGKMNPKKKQGYMDELKKSSNPVVCRALVWGGLDGLHQDFGSFSLKVP